jgi:RNA polymerase sigma-70 factor (ECF subfamily)
MNTTSISLLERVRSAPGKAAWDRLIDLYRPLIYGWLHQHKVQPFDADDLAQEVLALLVQELPRFQHNGQKGSFRSWLRTITANRMRSFWRAGRCRPVVPGDSTFVAMLDQIEDPHSELSRLWDRQHDDYVLSRLLDLMVQEFEPATLQVFRRVGLEGVPAETAAAEMGMSLGAVYVAKSRVLRRLRQEAQGLID